MTNAAPLGLRLFLEGIEVPVISANVNIQPSTPATAAIQVVPTDGVLRILPRTLVHLFYLDEAISEDDVRAARADGQENLGAYGPPPPHSKNLDRFQVADDSYKLLFAGEVMGVNYTKSNQQRSVVLQCMDLSSYWDTCYQWFANYSVHGGGFFDKAHIFCQAGSGLFDNITGGTSWVISQILNRPPKNKIYKKCKGLLGGMISLIEVVGGVRPDKNNYNAVRGINDFFTIAELRYNLAGMLGAVAGDTTSQRIYSGKAFRSWLTSGMTSLGNMISFRDIVRHVGKWVFHDIYPNPAAMYVGPQQYKVRIDASTLPRKSKARSLVKDAADQIDLAIGVVVDIIHAYVPPNQVSRLSIKGQWDACASPCLKAEEKLGKVLAMNISPKAHHQAADAQRKLEQVILKITVVNPAGVDPVPVKKTLESIKFIFDNLLRKQSKRVDKETGHHLFNQLLLPETFFMAPPRCNVIFPDQYTDFSYNRNFMREVTRLSCGSGLGWLAGRGGNSKVLSRYYYAPNIKSVDGTSLHQTLRRGAKVLLPHEVHSGIIPKIEWLSEGHKWGARKAKADNKEKKIHYIQKLANFQFFMHRWQARTIAVSGRFNPHVVLGFPALILDRSIPPRHVVEKIAKTLGHDAQSIIPTSYLGKIATLSHAINQSGGTTTINMTHCRTHDGVDDDFLGALQAGLTSHRKFKGENVTITIEPELMSNDPSYPKGGNRAKYIKLLVAVCEGINVSKKHSGEVATREELMAMGVPTAEINRLERVAKEKGSDNAIDAVDGVLFNEELFYVPEGYSSGFEQSSSMKDKRVPGVGRLKSVKFSDSTVQMDEWGMAAIGIHTQHLEKFAIGFARAAETTSKYTVPSKITITYRVYKPLKIQPEGGAFRVEDVMQPQWYDSVWQPDEIGPGVHETLLGCGAITDDNATAEGITEMYTAALGQEGAKVAFGGGDGSISIAQAVNTLGAHYSLLKEKGIDINAFVRAYTNRPIATLPQIMGSDDYDPVTKEGTEGFHSRAFGDYNTDVVFVEGQEPKAGTGALDGLLDGDHPKKNRLGDSVNEKIPAHLDPRGRARQRVAAYMAELNLSRGLQG